MGFKTSKEDYKNYVYVRIPKDEYQAIMEGKRKITKDDLEIWRFNYETKQLDKKAKAKRANDIKVARTVQKMYKALEDYHLGLFKEEATKLTPYKLAKLANVNYLTAKKFWERHNLDKWLDKFAKNPSEELRNFKVDELSKYFY